MSDVSRRPIDASDSQGHPEDLTHDRFEVLESCLVRHFPIYKAGEASWILRPTCVLKF